MKFSIKDFFSKWSHLVKKFLFENFIFCAVMIINIINILQYFCEKWR